MKVAVTGARGFLGRGLCDALAARGHAVIPIPLSDRLDEPDEARLIELLEPAAGVDLLINLAAALQPVSDRDRFINVEGPVVMADLLQRRAPGARFFHISSLSVVIDELRDSYTLSKREAERRLAGRRVRIIRPGLIWSFSGGGNAGRVERLLRKSLPLTPVPRPGNLSRPVLMETLADWLVGEAEGERADDVVNLLGRERLTLWQLIVDLKRRRGFDNTLLPVSAEWLTGRLPRFAQRALAGRATLQQLLPIDRTLDDRAVDGEKVFLDYP